MSTHFSTFPNGENYIIIKNIISKDICEFLSSYVIFKSNLKSNIRKNDALSGVHREYGDLVIEMLLEKITPQIEKATGKELWPTLSFCYLYKKGDKLTPHKDRSSCQFVAGLCIGADPDFKKLPEGWPLIINDDGKPNPIALDYGDMVIFKGHETEHWREAFSGVWFVSAIFGFVEKNSYFNFQKYDQRKMLGKPHVGMFRWYYGCIKNNIKYKI
ncbi:MAG: hypothetical protein HKM04_04780, partial [Legionellales bacterium]|nr:hypothetical protein [Legionellales bacterium]